MILPAAVGEKMIKNWSYGMCVSVSASDIRHLYALMKNKTKKGNSTRL